MSMEPECEILENTEIIEGLWDNKDQLTMAQQINIELSAVR